MKSEFEKWYRDKHQITKPLYFFEDTQRYEDGFTQDAWEVWQHQQTKVDELQKRLDLLEKAEFKLAQVRGILQNNPKLLESILVKKIEQALKGGGE